MARAGVWRLIGSIAATALPAAALAQATLTQGPPPSADIVVTAPKASPREVQQQARNVTQVTQNITHTPIALFQESVCPGVLGMPVEIASLIVGRIRYDAERVGIRTAPDGKCKPNIVVEFVRDGQHEVRALARKYGYVFEGISHAELEDLMAERGPVHAWVTAVEHGRHGETIGGRGDLVEPKVLNEPMAHSKIYLTTRMEIDSAVILLDITAVHGMSVYQIADYIAMRTFARTRPVSADGTKLRTILSLFDPQGADARPDELTPFDLAYLQAIYGTQANLSAYTAISAVSRTLKKNVATAETARE